MSGLTRSTGTTVSAVLIAVLGLSLIGYFMGRSRSVSVAGGNLRRLHSLPNYHGFYVALWCGLPSLLVALIWLAAQPAIVTEAATSVLPPERVASLDENQLSLLLSEVRQAAAHADLSQVADPAVRAGAETDRAWQSSCRTSAPMRRGGLALALVAADPGFAYSPHQRRRPRRPPPTGSSGSCSRPCCSPAPASPFLRPRSGSCCRWCSNAALLRADPNHRTSCSASTGARRRPYVPTRSDRPAVFGAVPLFTGTLLITAIAMLVAVPVGLMTAVYLVETTPPRVRAVVKPLLEILAGIPTVVYGFFAALTVAPWILRAPGEASGFRSRVRERTRRRTGDGHDDHPAGVVAGRRRHTRGTGGDARWRPRARRHASETMTRVILPAALPGIVRRRPARRLACHRRDDDRGHGGGLAANLTANPFEAVTTVTVQIVTLLVGDQEFDSPKTLAAFALGLVLFIVTLCLNILGLSVVRKYREQYD